MKGMTLPSDVVGTVTNRLEQVHCLKSGDKSGLTVIVKQKR